MAINYQSDEINFSHLKRDISSYTWHFFRQDITSALNVCLLTVPQAMAYALLAGLPLACGLFAAIFSAFIAPLLGSSRHLVVGPSNAIAILVQAGTSHVLFTYYRHLTGSEWDAMAVQILTQLVLLTALFQIMAAICKLGRLIQFVSHSVIVGYIAGTTIAIIISQLYVFLGIERLTGVHSFYEQGSYLLTHLHFSHLPTIAIGVCSLSMIIGLKRLDKRIPAILISLISAAVLVYLFDLANYEVEAGAIDPYSDEYQAKIILVSDLGGMLDFLPKLAFPYFDTGIINDLLPVAFALTLLGIMETTSVAKSIAASSGQRLSVNQEIFGIGIGNLVAAFIGGMPVSGSPSRTTMNFHNGAQTRFSAMFTAVFVGILVFTCGNLIAMIPLASLASLLLYSTTHIINSKQFFLCLKATRSDAFVLCMTLLSCIFLSLDIAFYIGVVLSITLYLKKAAIPHLVEYDIDEQGELINLNYGSFAEHKTIRVIKVEGELFFGAADLFQTTLKALAEDDNMTHVIILQVKNTRDIDATACLALQQLHDYLKNSGRQLICCGITLPLWEVLSDSGFVCLIKKENLFLFDERFPQLYMQKAMQRAKLFVIQAEKALAEKAVLDKALNDKFLDNNLEPAHSFTSDATPLKMRI